MAARAAARVAGETGAEEMAELGDVAVQRVAARAGATGEVERVAERAGDTEGVDGAAKGAERRAVATMVVCAEGRASRRSDPNRKARRSLPRRRRARGPCCNRR